MIGRGFTVALVVLTLVAAHKDDGRRRPELWAAVLTLSALQSPLAPGYATFPLIWLLSLRADEVHGAARVVGFAAIWALVAVVPPLAPPHLLLYTLGQQALVLGLAVHALLRTPNA